MPDELSSIKWENRWTIQWSHGGVGDTFRTRQKAIEDVVIEAYWADAVEVAGYDRKEAYREVMDQSDKAAEIENAVRRRDIIQKTWKKIRRRDGLNAIKVTRVIALGWT